MSEQQERMEEAAQVVAEGIHDWSAGGLPAEWPSDVHRELGRYYVEQHQIFAEALALGMGCIIERRQPMMPSDERNQTARSLVRSLNEHFN